MDNHSLQGLTVRLIPKCLRVLRRTAAHFLLNEKRDFSPKVVRFLYVGSAIAACLLLALKIRGALFIPIAEVREMANIVAIQSARDGTIFRIESYPDTIYMYGLLQAGILSHLPPAIDLLLVTATFLTKQYFLSLDLFSHWCCFGYRQTDNAPNDRTFQVPIVTCLLAPKAQADILGDA